MDTERRRLFLGLALSPELRKRLSRTISRWGEEAIAALIPTRVENFHVTLYYLGFIAEDEISGISEKVREAVAEVPAFEISFTSMQAVPDAINPKMIWLMGGASDELLALENKLEHAFSPYAKEKKSFRPHVTLARARRSLWQKLATGKRPELSATLSFIEPVDAVVLFESLVQDGERAYVPIDTFPLQ